MTEHRYVSTNGLRLHVATAGKSDGPLILLLHGFPEHWFGWRRQIEPLAEAGFSVWAPDQRGYNLSDKPAGIEPYRLRHLAADAAGLIDAAGRERAIVVGHDWGGAVTWHLAATRPEVVERAVILNAPHPAVMLRHLRRNPRQMLRSWSMLFFQIPWLPELWLKANRGRLLARALCRTSRRGAFSAQELKEYRDAWSHPKALKSMINWYRAAMRYPAGEASSVRIQAPTLLIWGARDCFLGREMAQRSIELCDHGRLEMIDEATHWAQHETHERVNELVLQFVDKQ